MAHFPLFLRLQASEHILIVGGGAVAAAKAETLAGLGMPIRAVAPDLSPQLMTIADKYGLSTERVAYRAEHLQGARLVVAATDDAAVNRQVHADAKSRGILVNVVDNPALCDVIFPAVVRRGPIQVAISTSGVSPVLARMLKQRIERVLPWNLQVLAGFLDEKKQAVRGKLKHLQARRLFLQRVVEGSIAEEVLEGNVQKASRLFDEALEEQGTKPQAALYLIGAGPGHPDLITVKAIRLLSEADVVLYDRLTPPALLERYARRDAEKICVGKTRDLHVKTQGEIELLIEQHLQKGRIVVRLKGGDPAIYAQGAGEIAVARRLGVPYQIVPGITAATGCAAAAGIPLTERGGARSVRFLTLYKDDLVSGTFWESLATAQDETLVFYMSIQHRSVVCEKLLAQGFAEETSVLLIEQGTTPEHREYEAPLGEFTSRYADHRFASPALLIIGDVVRWREKNGWKELPDGPVKSFFQPLEKSEVKGHA